MRLGGKDRADIGLVQSVCLHALEEEADGHGVSDVQTIRRASTTGDEATDVSETVDNDGTRVALCPGRGKSGNASRGPKWCHRASEECHTST